VVLIYRAFVRAGFFEMMEVLEKVTVVRRLDRAIEIWSSSGM